jgi:excinuclease UvrABC ATPase subunit
MEKIRIRGARTHNLRNVSLDLPAQPAGGDHRAFGSGKSSLAFDTLYAEGPAPLRRIALRVRAPVPAAHGEARTST